MSPNTILMNYDTFKKVQEINQLQMPYLDLSFPCSILGLNIKLDKYLDDGQFMIINDATELTMQDIVEAKMKVINYEQKLWEDILVKRLKK